MKFLVYGIGGVGGYFGGKLSQAGFHVSMIARGAHLKEIQKNGLQVESKNGDFTTHPKIATDNPEEAETPDVILMGVKSWQLKEAANSLLPVINADTMILPLQNGANNVEVLREVFPERQVLGGLCNIISFVKAPGIIKHASLEPKIIFGETEGSNSSRALELKKCFDKAEITNIISGDIQREIWRKFLFITTISAIGGLIRVTIDKIRESEYLYELMRKIALEILEVANAKGINLGQEDLENTFERIQNQPKGSTASTQRDIMEGKPSELENFNGYIVKEGERLGISTPVNRFIYECLLPMEKQARKG